MADRSVSAERRFAVPQVEGGRRRFGRFLLCFGQPPKWAKLCFGWGIKCYSLPGSPTTFLGNFFCGKFFTGLHRFRFLIVPSREVVDLFCVNCHFDDKNSILIGSWIILNEFLKIVEAWLKTVSLKDLECVEFIFVLYALRVVNDRKFVNYFTFVFCFFLCHTCNLISQWLRLDISENCRAGEPVFGNCEIVTEILSPDFYCTNFYINYYTNPSPHLLIGSAWKRSPK